jgi:hypothetical protein
MSKLIFALGTLGTLGTDHCFLWVMLFQVVFFNLEHLEHSLRFSLFQVAGRTWNRLEREKPLLINAVPSVPSVPSKKREVALLFRGWGGLNPPAFGPPRPAQR